MQASHERCQHTRVGLEGFPLNPTLMYIQKEQCMEMLKDDPCYYYLLAAYLTY